MYVLFWMEIYHLKTDFFLLSKSNPEFLKKYFQLHTLYLFFLSCSVAKILCSKSVFCGVGLPSYKYLLYNKNTNISFYLYQWLSYSIDFVGMYPLLALILFCQQDPNNVRLRTVFYLLLNNFCLCFKWL